MSKRIKITPIEYKMSSMEDVVPQRKRSKKVKKNRIYKKSLAVARNYNFHSFRRFAAEGKFVIMRSNANTPATYAMQFQLSDLPNYAEFTSLFDQYRIRTVVVKIKPKQTQGVLMPYDSTLQSPSPTLFVPNVWGAIDYDDSTATSPEALKEYSNAQNWQIT